MTLTAVIAVSLVSNVVGFVCGYSAAKDETKRAENEKTPQKQ